MLIRHYAPFLLFAASLARPQAIPVPPAPRQSATPTIRQTVNNVLVDVVVTDKHGQPVKGLAKERFEISENGVPQQVVFFEEHQAQPPSPMPPQAPQLPPNIYTDIPSAPPDNGPTLVLLMDALNTPVSDQVKVRAALIDYLHKIPQGRRIAIFTLTSRLRMVEGFNNDPSTLLASLANSANWQKQSNLTDDAGQDSYADFMTANLSQDSAYVAHEQGWRMDQKVSYTLGALSTLGVYLSAMPGRKNLLWFSGSFPLGMGPDAPMPQGFDPGKFIPEQLDRSRNYDAELHRTAELLKLARVAVYPLLAGGPSTPSQYSSNITSGSLTSSTSSLANPSIGINNANLESSNIASTYATMDTLAETTGGRAFHETNDLAAAINTIAELGSNYYTIAYVPKQSTYDGKYRKLSIKVDAPKVKLDYRRGYYAEDPDKAGIAALAHPERTSSALLHGAPAAADILFKVRVAPTEGRVEKVQAGAVRFSVNWSVDVRSMALAQSADGTRHGILNLVAVAYNADSKAIGNTSSTASLILQPNEYASDLKTGLQFHQEIDLPPGRVFLRVAIVDTANDRAGATEIPLDIHAEQANSAQSPTAR